VTPYNPGQITPDTPGRFSAIGGKPEVGLRHDTVGKIRDAAAVVLGVAASE
jgi:hypothetical protein